MEKSVLLVAALLFIGALSTSSALEPGESLNINSECTLELLDYSGSLAFVELNCGSPVTSFLAQGESLDAKGTQITFEGDDEGKASFSFEETPEIKSAEEAIQAGSAHLSGYPAESIEAIEADCNGRAAWGECWAIYAYETIIVEGKTIEVNNEAIELPGYSRTKGRIVYLNREGEVERLLEVT